MFGGLYRFQLDCFLIFYTRLLGLTESFYDEIKALPLEDDNSKQATGFGYGSAKGKLKKRKGTSYLIFDFYIKCLAPMNSHFP